MAPLKLKGDRAEIEVARDLIRRGFRIAIPHGEDWDFDLIFSRPAGHHLERVQVKYCTSDAKVIELRACSHSLTNGRVRHTKRYTAETIDWLAAYDVTTDQCYYVPADELGTGMAKVFLRLVPARNAQRTGIRLAQDYLDPEPAPQLSLEVVEPAGFEPATSCLQGRRSPN
jgi:PD-(D/E)XK endonuclease